MTKVVKQHPQYWLLRFIAALPYGFLYSIARFAAFCAWHSASRLRRITELNIGYCFPALSSAEQKKLSQASLRETINVGLEMPKVLFQDVDKSLAQIVQVSGKEHIDALLAGGSGVIVLAPHLGNWEYLGLYLGQHYDTVSLYKPSGHPLMDTLVQQGRSSSGAKLMPTNKKGVMTVLKHLKRGGVTGILPDQVPIENNAWVNAEFYGHKAPTMSLVANLAKKPGVKAVAAFAKRLDNNKGQFEIIFQAVDEAIYSGDSSISSSAMNHAVEKLISEAPAQYQWEYKRFKWNAEGQKHTLYRK